jgi:hypothetical protein
MLDLPWIIKMMNPEDEEAGNRSATPPACPLKLGSILRLN